MKNFTDYEKENIKKELEKNLDYHKALLKAWEQVTRNYKKDGKPFQDLQKNFNNARVYNAAYSMVTTKEIRVDTCTKLNGYQHESIENRELAKYTKFTPDESRIIKKSFLEPYFYLTLDEIEIKIDEKKAYHAKRIAELEKAIRENKKDTERAEKILEYIEKELAKVNPDAASLYKEKLIRKYY